MILKRNFEMLKKDSRVLREATALIEAGYEVTILIYSGPRDKEGCFKYLGINILSVPIKNINLLKNQNVFNTNFKSHKCSNNIKKFIYKSIHYIYKLRYENLMIKRALELKADVYHCHDFETLKIGCKIKKNKKCKLVYDSHEIFMEQESFQIGFNKIIKKIFIRIENKLIKKTDINITINESISNYFSEKYLIEKPYIIMNVPEEIEIDFKKEYLRKALNIEKSKKIVLYQGVLSEERGLKNLIEAFKYVEDNIVLVFMGFGPMYDDIKDITENNRFRGKIYLLDAVSPKILLNYTKDADLGIHPIPNTCLNNYYCTPNKIMEYIMAGVPVLASDFPEIRKILLDKKIGDVFNYADINDISNKINKLLSIENLELYSMMKKDCYYVKQNKYNWRIEKNKLIDIYKSLYI